MLGRKNEEEEENDRSSVSGWEGGRDLGVQNVIISSECHSLIHFIYVPSTSWDKLELRGILTVASASFGPLASSPVLLLVQSKWSFLRHQIIKKCKFCE